MERDKIDFGTLDVAVLFRKLFIPTLLGTFCLSSVSTIDGVFIGHSIGSNGIGAINLTYPIFLLMAGIGLMIGGGCSIVASIHLAHAKSKAARLNVTQAILFVSFLALFTTVAIALFPRPVARLLGASDTLLPLVTDYLCWYCPAFVFYLCSTVSLFLIRLDGSPHLAMWCNIISALSNVVLDWIFILIFGWGISGAALASAISVMIPGVTGLVYMAFFARTLRFYRLKLSVKSLRLSLRNIGYQCRVGFSSLLGEILLAVLLFTGNLVFMHYLGDSGVGAFGIVGYYLPFIYMTGNAIMQSAQPIVSYNFGTGNTARIATIKRILTKTSICCGCIVAAAFFLIPDAMVSLFLDSEDEAARIAVEGFPYIAFGFGLFIVNLAVIGYYQSMERVAPATLFNLLQGFVFLLPCFLLLPEWLGTPGIWLALTVAEALTSAVIFGFILLNRRKNTYSLESN